MKRERTITEQKAEHALSKRYRKIGIGSVAAAARYRSRQEKDKPKEHYGKSSFRGTSPRHLEWR